MKRLEFWLSEKEIELSKKPGSGYFINILLEEKERLITQIKGITSYHLILSHEERVQLLVFALFTETPPLNMKMFSPRIGVSLPTIYSDFDEVETWLNQHGLKLIRQPGHGIKIEGSELNLRKGMHTVIFDMISQISILALYQGKTFEYRNFCQYIMGLKEVTSFDPTVLEFEACHKLVKHIEDNCTNKMTDSSFLSMVVFFVILLNRATQGFYLSELGMQTADLETTREYSIAIELTEIINRDFETKLTKAETINIAANILGIKNRQLPPSLLTDSDLEPSIDDEDVETLLREIIREAAKLLNPILNVDQQLFQGLIIHLKPAVHRLKYGLPIRNHLLNEIKHEYPYIFQVAENTGNILETYFGKPVPDEEIGYLAMHFAAAMERLNSHSTRRVKTILVCGGGCSTAWMLVSRLATQFPDLEVVGVKSAEDLRSLPLDRKDADIVISTVPLQIEGIPLVFVSPLLTENDKINIAQTVGLGYTPASIDKFDESADRVSITSLLTRDTVQLDIYGQTWQEAVEKSCLPLLGNGSIESEYVESVKELIEQFGPYMVVTSGVVLLHGLIGVGVNRLSMSLTRFNPPVYFGHAHNDPVKLGFLIATPDNHSHLRALKDLSKFLDDGAFLNLLDTAETSEELVGLIHLKIQPKTAKYTIK